jgi:hypothetical protein
MGCSQLVSVKGGKVIDIEGNPDSPINEGTLCPKGANTFQLAVNPHRVTKVLYRAPYSTQWKQPARMVDGLPGKSASATVEQPGRSRRPRRMEASGVAGGLRVLNYTQKQIWPQMNTDQRR